ncbi:ATPase, P-type (transporting), HAD superfamily, subfamily IC [Lachnospiraceae bacterium XBB1006]|nr:ATPase, P-type (transporting), HAD superfamily, subfamily IC [Lachnospiraceae bacterium XBB1006]
MENLLTQSVFGAENSVTIGIVTMVLFIPVLYVLRGYCKEGAYALMKKSATKESVITVAVCLSAFLGFVILIHSSYALGHGDRTVLLYFRENWFFLSAIAMLLFFYPVKYWEKKALARVKKAPSINATDAFATVLIYAGTLLAVITGFLWIHNGANTDVAVERLICVLLLSCPCAVSLVAPIALMSGMEKAEKKNIQFKNGASLENLEGVDTVYVTKKRVITQGQAKVDGVFAVRNNLTEVEVPYYFAVLASMMQKNYYFARKALQDRCKIWKVTLLPVESVTNVELEGVSGSVHGNRYFAGTLAYIAKQNIPVTTEVKQAYEEFLEKGKSVVLLANAEEVLMFVAIYDAVKEESLTAIRTLQNMHTKVVMLTEEDEVTAKAHGTFFGVNDVVAYTTDAKLTELIRKKKEQEQKVAVFGMGCKEATIRIGDFSDATVRIEGYQIQKLVEAVHISKEVMRYMKGNMWFLFFYHALSIPISAGVLYNRFAISMHPIIAAGIMCLSAMIVVGNTLRLRKE